ncbi:PREDICTED: uncharacterized protein LOC108758323 [Trachymyrmex cornetzi]|uniref:uncharacterized protein LOC108758323 n=1 Tax=Trachymyrmex cornetzi TaxID=471704 RepID=UPI00084F31C6|nr:PREDICTED: uncharacterized protein LOC108758323 [Trachymyrmex cornetzi]
MIFTILCSLVIGRSIASPLANVWLSPIPALSPLRQYHIQDGSGSYQYSFTGPHHAKAETTLNGVTQGGYSYIDANGVLQTVSYTADDKNGFRVSASNLPQPPKDELQTIQDTPEVAAAKRNHLEELQKSHQANWQDQNLLSYKILPSYFSFAQIQPDDNSKAELNSKTREIEATNNPFLLSRSEAERINVPKPDPSLSKVSPTSSGPTITTIASSLPTTTSLRENTFLKDDERTSNQNALHLGKLLPLSNIQKRVALPAPYVLPVLPYRLLHSSLHHTQDSLGQYDYSYTGDSSAKTESRSLDGTTRGAYSYIDPNGILQQVHYIADHNGFRVMATNLPEAK